MTTLLALYRRPDGGPEALADFERRYGAEHLPLVAGTPGLRSTTVQRVVEALGGETDLVLVTAMTFDDRAALDAGLGVRRDARRRAATCARSRPGLATLLVLEDAPGAGGRRATRRAGSAAVDTVGVTDAARPRASPVTRDPCRLPGPGTRLAVRPAGR